MVRISNLNLIKILRENARTPLLEIARMLGVSEAAVRKRLRRLEREGVIRRYTVEVDPRKLGYNVVALIGVDTKPEHYIPLLERFKRMGEVVSLYASSGDHMMMAECWFRRPDELTAFVERLRRFKGVVRVCPAVILEKIK